MALGARQKATLYHQWGSLSSGGLNLIQSVESLLQHPPSNQWLTFLNECLQALKKGVPISQIFETRRDLFALFEISMIQAGEKSGRLEVIFQELSSYWERIGSARRRITAGLGYPLVVFHIAVIAGAFPVAFREGGGWGLFLGQVLFIFSIFYIICFLGWLFFKSRFWHSMEPFFSRMPILGNALRTLWLYRYVLTLRIQLEAGLALDEAVDVACMSSGSHQIESFSGSLQETIRKGESLVVAFEPLTKLFPILKPLIASGTESGKLTETLAFLEQRLADEVEHSTSVMADWVPKIFYFLVVFYVLFQIFRTMQPIFQIYRDAASGF